MEKILRTSGRLALTRRLLTLEKGLNSLIILGAWTLRTHSNRCVFYGASPSVSRAMVSASEELHLWGLAGARGVNHLLALVSNEEWSRSDVSFFFFDKGAF